METTYSFIHPTFIQLMDCSTVCRGKNYDLCLQEANRLEREKGKKTTK